MFGKKKSHGENEDKSAQEKMDNYAYRAAKKEAEKDPEFRKRLIAAFIGDAEYQPDESIKKALAEIKAKMDLIKAESACAEAEVHRQALNRIMSSPELTDRYVLMEVQRLTETGNTDTERVGQQIDPRRQDSGQRINPFRQMLNIMDAADKRRERLNREVSGGAGKGVAAPSGGGGAGLRRVGVQLKNAGLVGGNQGGKEQTAVEEKSMASADAPAPTSPSVSTTPSTNSAGSPEPESTVLVEKETGDGGDDGA
jgi:hypothetical protein